MRQAVENAIAEQVLFESGDHVLIGVSGGADSVALVYVLHYLRDALGIKIKLAHLHHGIRGLEADADLAAVRLLAARLNLTLVYDRCDVPALAAKRGISIEMAAREARLNFFRQQAEKQEIDKVTLAHNADDQAETVLLRLARGAGKGGLSGIAVVQNLQDLIIVRPMLQVTHQQAKDFLMAHNLSWREDSSNRSMQHLRNCVRHEVIPFLAEKLNAGIREALRRSAEVLAVEDDCMDTLAGEILSQVRNSESHAIDIEMLSKQHLAIRRRVLLLWLFECGVPAHLVGFDKVEAIEILARSMAGNQRVCIGGGLSAIRNYGELRIQEDADSDDAVCNYVIAIPGSTRIDELGVVVATEWSRGIIKERDRNAGELPAAATIAAEKVDGFELRVRTWRAGDRMKPYGLAGTKKLQDIFTDQKVPDYRRDRIPIFELRDEIVWIPGYRIAADWVVEDENSRCLRMEATPL